LALLAEGYEGKQVKGQELAFWESNRVDQKYQLLGRVGGVGWFCGTRSWRSRSSRAERVQCQLCGQRHENFFTSASAWRNTHNWMCVSPQVKHDHT